MSFQPYQILIVILIHIIFHELTILSFNINKFFELIMSLFILNQRAGPEYLIDEEFSSNLKYLDELLIFLLNIGKITEYQKNIILEYRHKCLNRIDGYIFPNRILYPDEEILKQKQDEYIQNRDTFLSNFSLG